MTVGQASTTTAIISSPNPSVTGQPVTLTATVLAVGPGTGTPTGSVNFYSGSTLLDTATLSDGVGTYTTTTLPAGTSSIDAVYSGDSNFTASTSATINQVVAQGTATVSISASNTNPFALQPITLTAIVSVVSGLGTPTGSVTFQDSNGTTLGTATLTSGTATLTVNALPIGTQSITAVYSGDSNFLTKSSAAIESGRRQPD